MTLRALRNEIEAVNKALPELNRGLKEAVDLTRSVAQQPIPLPLPPSQPQTISRRGTGERSGGGGRGGGGAAGGAGRGGIVRSQVLFPFGSTPGRPGLPRTVEQLGEECTLIKFPVPDAVTGQTKQLDAWRCPDGSIYLVPIEPTTISAESRGGGPRGGAGRRRRRGPQDTVGQDVGGGVAGRDFGFDLPRRGGLSTGPIVGGLKAVAAEVAGLRADLRRGDGGTGARARGDL